MSNIAVLGAGAMGSALAITAASKKQNKVCLLGSPLDNQTIISINNNRWHPTLNVEIPARVSAHQQQTQTTELLQQADIIVIGVSSPGINWAVNTINASQAQPRCIALVTKGLVAARNPAEPPSTYATALNNQLDNNLLLGIGGPCIARELALGIPTSVTFSATHLQLASEVAADFQTDYYRIDVHPDFVALEACAALKNFYCIGVSAMLGTWKIDDVAAKNPVAALFNQAVKEMALVSDWINQENNAEQTRLHSHWSNPAYDLPGMGDLHVTVGGGRNSRLGKLLGNGNTLNEIVTGPMKDVTVEGLDTGKQLLSGFRFAINKGILCPEKLPLTLSILNCIEHDCLFEFELASLPLSHRNS